jgi:anthranilate synthase/aminodeoxychorismate synthase-like glutamine amidotransferase
VLLLVDNYDSFSHNLVHLFRAQGADVRVVANDTHSVAQLLEMNPSHVVISPGPGSPRDAGVSVALIQQCTVPLLGVCLGHQSIAAAFGGLVIRAPWPTHGRAHAVTHTAHGLFTHAPQPLVAGRYHSLVVDPSTLPACLEVTARTDDGLIMGLRHRTRAIAGVQFHPESVLTPDGGVIARNFLAGVL